MTDIERKVIEDATYLNLGGAIAQMIHSDDQIICDRVREAHRKLSELLVKSGRQERQERQERHKADAMIAAGKRTGGAKITEHQARNLEAVLKNEEGLGELFLQNMGVKSFADVLARDLLSSIAAAVTDPRISGEARERLLAIKGGQG